MKADPGGGSTGGSARILVPGVMTTVQDAGRPGYESLGIPRGGACDYYAYSWANRLAVCAPGAAVLEALLDGPTLSFSKDLWIATTGTERITVDGNTAPGWTGMPILAGQRVAMGAPSGARAYLTVRGGFDVPVVLGSRSTNLESGFGGFHGRALVAGDIVTVGEHNAAGLPDGTLRHPGPPVTSRPLVVRVVFGPDDFSQAALQVFLDSEFRMSPRSNHIGIRLDGPAIESRSRGDLISRPMPVGGVQITPAGQPVVLLAARGTIGGYPLIATAIACDIWRLGQLRSGDSVRFEAVSIELGREISLEAYRELETQQPIAGR